MVPDLGVRVVISAGVSPSEDPEKVTVAVMNVAGGVPGEVERGATQVRYSSDRIESLVRFRDQLRDRRVRAAARRLLEDARMGNRTELMVNRQAAFAGVIALCGSADESPLGPVYLSLDSEDLDRLIGWLTAYEGG